MEVTKLSGIGRRLFEVIEFDSDEELLYEIRKHPIGLVIIYLVGFGVAALLILLMVIGPIFLSDEGAVTAGIDITSVKLVVAVVGAVLSVLAIGMTAIGAYLYQSNVVLVTSEKIAQVLYRSIFDRKISQLGVGDVQDVTVAQNGVLARMFDFGTLTVETSGEQQNYLFTFTPKPYLAAKAIVGAHEENLKKFGN